MTSFTLHDGEGRGYYHGDLLPDNNGTLTSWSLPHGHLFIELDGQAYGSLMFAIDADGKPVITLGQYAPQFDQWAPENPLTKPEEV